MPFPTALPALTDNYIWTLAEAGADAIIVDPGEAEPVLAAMRQGLRPRAILVTHHHHDHTGGVAELVADSGAAVFGPVGEVLPEPVTRVGEGDRLQVLGQDFEVIAVPGHTAGHVAYFGNHVPGGPLLFCGDTLFSGGCGRLFEGTPAQMLASLDRLNGLPAATRVCCAHEYTLSNLRFAQAVEPGNAALQAYLSHCEALRARGAPTLPSQLATERLVNPFLRSRDPGLRAGLAALATVPDGDVAVFATLRELKNNFRPA